MPLCPWRWRPSDAVLFFYAELFLKTRLSRFQLESPTWCFPNQWAPQSKKRTCQCLLQWTSIWATLCSTIQACDSVKVRLTRFFSLSTSRPLAISIWRISKAWVFFQLLFLRVHSAVLLQLTSRCVHALLGLETTMEQLLSLIILSFCFDTVGIANFCH